MEFSSYISAHPKRNDSQSPDLMCITIGAPGVCGINLLSRKATNQ